MFYPREGRGFAVAAKQIALGVGGFPNDGDFSFLSYPQPRPGLRMAAKGSASRELGGAEREMKWG